MNGPSDTAVNHDKPAVVTSRRHQSPSLREGRGLSRGEGNNATPLCYLLLVFTFIPLLSTGCTKKRQVPPTTPTSYFDITNSAEVRLPTPFAPRNTVLLFLKTDCPIGNRYVPKIKELANQFGKGKPNGKFRFHLAYPACDLKQIESHQKDYGLEFQTFRDPDHVLVNAIGITRAPEVAVYDATGTRVYRGRIDDQHVEFGVSRPAPTSDDLRDTLQSLVDGQTLAPRETQAIGCYIE